MAAPLLPAAPLDLPAAVVVVAAGNCQPHTLRAFQPSLEVCNLGLVAKARQPYCGPPECHQVVEELAYG